MTREKRFQLRQSFILLFTALIWGAAFVAQSVGMDYIGPFTLIGIRFLLGALTLLPVVLWQGRSSRRDADRRKTRDGRAMTGGVLIRGGILCGVFLGTASMLQQFGIARTTVGKAGFLTALYIVIVPVYAFFLGRRTKPLIWLCVAIACAGIYFLSMPGGRFTLMAGDALCLASAFVFGVQIMLVGYYAELADGVRLAVLEFLTASAMGFVLMLIFEHPQADAVIKAAWPLLYLGVMSSGVAYTLQFIGQRGLNPTIASLIMSLESAVSAIAGFFLLHHSPRFQNGRSLKVSFRKFFQQAFQALCLIQYNHYQLHVHDIRSSMPSSYHLSRSFAKTGLFPAPGLVTVHSPDQSDGSV